MQNNIAVHDRDQEQATVMNSNHSRNNNCKEFLSKGLLPEVRMKDEVHARIASLAQTRDKLVKLRTTLKNNVNNLLAARGILMRKESLASEKGLAQVLASPVSELERMELEILVVEIRHLNESIKKMETLLREQGPKLPGWENLTSIKGIGDTGATVLLSTIGNIDDVADEGKLAAYFGIVPRVSNSNDTQHSGHITKQGCKLGRTVLVQCAMIAARYSAYLQAFYRRIAATRGTGKAIIALARKFLGIIYKTLKNKWVFEDFPAFKLARCYGRPARLRRPRLRRACRRPFSPRPPVRARLSAMN
jgi:transposase